MRTTIFEDGDLHGAEVTNLENRITLLSEGVRSDIVLVDRRARREFLEDDREEIVETSELVRLLHRDKRLGIEEEDFYGEWVLPYIPEKYGV